MSNSIPINFGNKIDCLNASTEPVIIAIYQPKLDLISDATRGPHHPEAAVESTRAKLFKFLGHAVGLEAKLIILPEYCLPYETFLRLCRNETAIPAGTLLIAPIETLKMEVYSQIEPDIQEIDQCSCRVIPIGNERLGECCVNPTAIIAFKNNSREVYVQPKRYHSKWERDINCKSDKFFLFHGNGISLTALICSDANSEALIDEQMNSIHLSTGKYIIHTQWNPSANSSIYNFFWDKALKRGATNKGSTILISANVAKSSIISQVEDTDELVEVPFTGITFNGEGDADKVYMNDELYSSFKALRHSKYTQIFYSVYPSSSIHLLQIKRPYENAPPEDRS